MAADAGQAIDDQVGVGDRAPGVGRDQLAARRPILGGCTLIGGRRELTAAGDELGRGRLVQPGASRDRGDPGAAARQAGRGIQRVVEAIVTERAFDLLRFNQSCASQLC